MLPVKVSVAIVTGQLWQGSECILNASNKALLFSLMIFGTQMSLSKIQSSVSMFAHFLPEALSA